MAMALGVTLGASAVPQYLQVLDDVRASGAARQLRPPAARADGSGARSAMVGLQFTARDGRYGYALYVDGNRNGVLTDDIQRGIDRLIAAIERLPDQFTGVEFGHSRLAAGRRRGSRPGRSDPPGIRQHRELFGRRHGVLGHGLHPRPARRQYAVRIFGETGKTRLLKFEPETGKWRPL